MAFQETDIFQQTHHIESNRIYTTTRVRMDRIAPEAVEAALIERPWDWWKHGKIFKWQRQSDGGIRFILAPVWPRLPSLVGIHLSPPVRSETERESGTPIRQTVFEAQFFAGFDGPGRYEVLDSPEGCVLNSVWDGVACRGFKRLLPINSVLKMHLDAERGALGFPYPSGTGFIGLVEALSKEKRAK